MTGDKKAGATPAIPGGSIVSAKSAAKRRSVSTKRLYWALMDYVEATGLTDETTVKALLENLGEDVLLEMR